MAARRLVVTCRNNPAQSRSYPQYIEVVAAYEITPQSLIDALVAHAERRELIGDEAGEHLVSIPIVLVVGIRKGSETVPFKGAVERDQFTGPFYWQGPQQQGVYDAEDGRVGSDAQPECEDRNNRKSRPFDQNSKSVASVPPHGLQPPAAAHVIAIFLDSGDRPE